MKRRNISQGALQSHHPNARNNTPVGQKTTQGSSQIRAKRNILDYYQRLGFTEGEAFILRASKGKKQKVYFGRLGVDGFQLWHTKYTGKDKDSLAIYEQRSEVRNPVALLQQLWNKEYDIFSYPNHVQGGLGNKHAKGFSSIFFEFDDLPLDEQWEKVKELEQVGLVPSQVVFSGGRSLHVYFRLNEAVSAQEWKLLNQMLAAYMGSDPSICTLARAMRLPGVNRIKDGKTKAVEIQSQSDAVYSPQQVKEILGVKFPHGLSDERWRYVQQALKSKKGTDKKERKLDKLLILLEDELNPKPHYPRSHKNQPADKTITFPLEICLTRDDRDLVANGAGSYRNDTGRKLALNLIGTAKYLEQKGYSFDGDPYNLFIDYCQRCPSGGGWDQHEWDTIWKSAEGDNPTPTLSDEILKNCILAWQWKQLPESERRKYRNRVRNKQHNPEKEESTFIQLLRDEMGRFARKLKGFGHNLKEKKVKLPPKIIWDGVSPLPTPKDYAGKPRPHVELEDKRDRARLVTELKRLGWTDIFMTDFPGEGKSNFIGHYEPVDGNTIWYLDPNHRNVSTESVRDNYVDLNPRHDGIYRDEKGKLQIARTPQQKLDAEIASNCLNADLFTEAQRRGYKLDSEDSDNPICSGCRYRKACGFASGEGYGFKAQRRDTLAHSKIRADFKSVSPDVIDEGDTAIFEEVSRQLEAVKRDSGGWLDLLSTFDDLEHEQPELWELLKPIKDQIRPIFAVKQPRWGFDHNALLELLGDVPETISKVIEQLEPLNSLDELVRQAGSFAEVEYYFEKLPHNLLLPLLKVWAGVETGRLRLLGNDLTVTTIDDDYLAKVYRFGFRVYLDATANIPHLIHALRLNPNTCISVSGKMPRLNNLMVYETHMEGLGSRDISDTAKKRIAAYKKHWRDRDPHTAFLSFKDQEDIDGHWGHDNRGSNDFKGLASLVSFGTPRPNLGAMQDEYFILYGSLDGFDDWYAELIAAEIVQDVGRQRVQHYPDRQFICDFVGTDQDLSFLTRRYGIKVMKRYAFKVCPQAGTEGQYAKWVTLEAAHQIQEAGEKLTQVRLSQKTGFAQSYIAKLTKEFKGGWREFKKLSLSLYKSLWSSDNSKESFSYLDDWLNLDPLEVIEDFARVIVEFGWESFREQLEDCSPQTQILLLWWLEPLLNPESKFADSGG